MKNRADTVFLPVTFVERPEPAGDHCVDIEDAERHQVRPPVVRFQDQPSFLPQGSGSSLVIGLIDHYRFSQECLIRALQSLNSADTVVTFTTIEACIAADRVDLDLVIYYSHEISALQSATQSSVAAIRRAYPTVPLVVLSDTDDEREAEASRKMLESGANGFIPTRTSSVFITVGAIRLVKDGGALEPFEQRRPARRPDTHGVERPSRLTAREMAVLGLLQRGKANKIIAHELSMSENTVKIHVRNIMRKMDATNRTQAVDKARTLWGGTANQASAGVADPPPLWCRRRKGDRRGNPT